MSSGADRGRSRRVSPAAWPGRRGGAGAEPSGLPGWPWWGFVGMAVSGVSFSGKAGGDFRWQEEGRSVVTGRSPGGDRFETVKNSVPNVSFQARHLAPWSLQTAGQSRGGAHPKPAIASAVPSANSLGRDRVQYVTRKARLSLKNEIKSDGSPPMSEGLRKGPHHPPSEKQNTG